MLNGKGRIESTDAIIIGEKGVVQPPSARAPSSSRGNWSATWSGIPLPQGPSKTAAPLDASDLSVVALKR